MFIVIDNRLRSIKHIQNNFFGGVDVIMTGDFYQATPMKDSWIFQNTKNNVNALTPNFWQIFMNEIKLCDSLIWFYTNFEKNSYCNRKHK
jgi:hypothetical protein